MSFCYRLDKLLFPYDFSEINNRGRCLTPIQYTFYRFTILILIAVSFSYVAYFYRAEDLMMFTTWGITMSLICVLYMFLENIAQWIMRNRHTQLKYWKVSHFLFTLTVSFEGFINGVYWLGMFPYSITQKVWGSLSPHDISISIMAHAVPFVILLFDLQMNLIVCWNFAYLPFFVMLLICYLIVNCLYSILQVPLYSEIDYTGWLTYVFLVACAAAIVICLFILRLFCKFCKQDSIKKLLLIEERTKIQNSAHLMKIMSSKTLHHDIQPVSIIP